MSTRKLKALGYPKEGSFNIHDEAAVRDLVVWLEDRIFYTELPHHVLTNLRAANSEHAWNLALHEYFTACDCPFDCAAEMPACLDWLLREALRLTSATHAAVTDNQAVPSSIIVPKAESPSGIFANVDLESDAFRWGIGKMAAMLNVSVHPDPAVMLVAVGNLLSTRLAAEGTNQNRGTIFTCKLQEVTLGFDQPGMCTESID